MGTASRNAFKANRLASRLKRLREADFSPEVVAEMLEVMEEMATLIASTNALVAFNSPF